jgi:hypothetical protein
VADVRKRQQIGCCEWDLCRRRAVEYHYDLAIFLD